MTQKINPAAAQELLIAEAEHHVLRLRELLVRGDENLKAWQLLSCVPYWARTAAIDSARLDQFEMVKHALHPEVYAEYYAENPHERPFEEQYGISVAEACDRIPRFGMLRDWLRAEIPAGGRLIDLSGNDGAMAAALHLDGYDVDVFDLNPRCVARAKERDTGGWALQADFRDEFGDEPPDYVAAVLFETLEHLADPLDGLRAAARYAPVLWVSTPWGAVEQLNLPGWAHVERKGHLHSFTANELNALLEEIGTVEFGTMGPDRVLVARVLVSQER